MTTYYPDHFENSSFDIIMTGTWGVDGQANFIVRPILHLPESMVSDLWTQESLSAIFAAIRSAVEASDEVDGAMVTWATPPQYAYSVPGFIDS